MSSQINWMLETDSIGGLKPLGESSYSNYKGNFHISNNDTLTIIVTAGGIVNQLNTQLCVQNNLGSLELYSYQAYEFGSLIFRWNACTFQPGPTYFSFKYTSFEDGKKRQGCKTTIIIDPCIHINGQVVDVNKLCLQTVLSHCLGTIDTWFNKIASNTHNLKYNALHFTPFQEFGLSNSCFSIADHLKVNEELLTRHCLDGFDELSDVITNLRSKLNMFSTTDIVLNHTASNTAWLKDHPECGYNEVTAPHLSAAIELDVSLEKFSMDLANNKLTDKLLINEIYNEEKIDEVAIAIIVVLAKAIEDNVLYPFKIHEWFMIDQDRVIADFNKDYDTEAKSNTLWDECYDKKLKMVLEECFKTVGVERVIGVKPSIKLLRKLFRNDEECRECLHNIQIKLFVEADHAFHEILDSIIGHVRWERVSKQKGAVETNFTNSLVPRYFTPVETGDQRTLHFANNGWVLNYNLHKDFVSPGSLAYLKRQIVVWSDCVKLRYGDSYESSPFLWNYMKTYCQKLSLIFDGLRLDNCHSTPINVAKYLLDECRKIKPNIWIYAELFTGDQNIDLMFERELGLNALIRESLQASDVYTLGRRIEEYSGRLIGALEPVLPINQCIYATKPKLLFPKLAKCIFYDFTHDNETLYQSASAIRSLPNAAAVAATNCPIASTRTYDELYPYKIPVWTKSFSYSTNQSSEISSCIHIYTTMYIDAPSVMVAGSWDQWLTKKSLIRGSTGWFVSIPLNAENRNFKKLEYKFYVPEYDIWFYDPNFPVAYNHEFTNNVYTDQILSINTFLLKGITKARYYFNKIHQYLIVNEFSEIKCEVVKDRILVIKRHQPKFHSFYIFIIHMAMGYNFENVEFSYIVEEELEQIVLEASILVEEPNFVKQNTGLRSQLHISCQKHISESKYFQVYCNVALNQTKLNFNQFPPGAVVILSTNPILKNFKKKIKSNVIALYKQVNSSIKQLPTYAIMELCSYVLFSCEAEELVRSYYKRGCYGLKNYKFPYAGISGVIPILNRLRYNYDPNHELVINICEGNWLAAYFSDRLNSRNHCLSNPAALKLLNELGHWLNETFQIVLKSRKISRQLLPYYYDIILSSFYHCISSIFLNLMGHTVATSYDVFIKLLSLATLQFYSYVPSKITTEESNDSFPSLCAGLPHFSTGFMRCWGRDTFITLNGHFNFSGKISHIKAELCKYGDLMRHGLIPNLLDSKINPRYNCRDAVWYFLECVKSICLNTKYGTEFLLTPVQLQYQEFLPPDCKISNFADLVHYILQSHATGIHYREVNAGIQIDEHMTDNGFNVDIQLNLNNGLIYGGNKYNCGTWMDKMGSSECAKTKGIPATPRDGAAIELNGILCSILSFITNLDKCIFPYDSVTDKLSYKAWLNLLLENLDKSYFISETCKEAQYTVKNYYRDTIDASNTWQNNQLRPNACIALACSPESFNSKNAIKYLELVSTKLLNATSTKDFQKLIDSAIEEVGDNIVSVKNWFNRNNIHSSYTKQLGIKTLSPDDPCYRGFYSNNDNSTDPSISHGYSYHNGPEWLWLLGYYLKALNHFLFYKFDDQFFKLHSNADDSIKKKYIEFECMRYLIPHREYILNDDWLSLPELTNENAELNHFGCRAQAWSVGTIVGFIYSVFNESRNGLPHKL